MNPRSSTQELMATRVIDHVLASLPKDLAEEAAKCAIELCTMNKCARDEPGLEDDLLGLFEGHARHDPEPQSAEELPRIRLFLDNLWEFANADPRIFKAEVRTTLLHELGHFLGLDEDGVEALGLA